MNYYPHHIGDFNNATRHLTRIERCVYRELIELYYDTEEPLINDISYLCRRILATSEQESAAVEQVLNEFFALDNNEEFFVNARCEKVIKEYQSNKKNKSKAGKASARSRKAMKLKEKEVLTPVEQPLNSRSTDEQLTNNQNQEPKPEPIKDKDKAKAKRFVPVYSDWNNWDWPAQPDEDVFDSWLAARKKIKGGISELSFKRLGKEFCKATNLNDCLAEMELRGWKGFKSDWMQNNSGVGNGRHQQNTGSMSAVDKVKQATEQWAKDRSAGSEAGRSDDSVVATYDRNIRS